MTGPAPTQDHGGNLDAAIARFGGAKEAWLDLSTGINPVPFPVNDIPPEAWTSLPDTRAMDRLLAAARAFWNVPAAARIVAAPGASSLIRALSTSLGHADLSPLARTDIETPTYNEWGAAFHLPDHVHTDDPPGKIIRVHPNNPDGRLMAADQVGKTHFTIIDESFCDTAPDLSHIARTGEPGVVVVKSFGKFWGLAGLRLGFVIGEPYTLGLRDDASVPFHNPGYTSADIREALGPWPVSGPALEIGARALKDHDWAEATRKRLTRDADRLDRIMLGAGATLVGGTPLFRTYDMPGGAATWQERLAQGHIWSRIFPYSGTWMRLGLPGSEAGWAQLEAAL